MSSLLRKSHFLGTKFRGLTLQEVSARCIQQNAALAPSVSYLRMIETGQHIPSAELLGLLAEVFQKDPRWFLDGNPEVEVSLRANRGGATRIPLEPGFLFSRELLEAAIAEVLAQTSTSGRQFAHLLIGSHREMSRNESPDLERSAEEIGKRQFTIAVDDILRLCARLTSAQCARQFSTRSRAATGPHPPPQGAFIRDSGRPQPRAALSPPCAGRPAR